MDEEINLYLDIDDDLKHIQFFDVDVGYGDHADSMTNTVRVSVFAGDGCVAYMECALFYDERINESVYDHEYVADSIVQDAYDAMIVLRECTLLAATDENRSLGELLTSYPTVTVYLHQLAVRKDYRHRGIGNWFLRNLSQILQRNYSVFPRVIIILLSPQKINWAKSPPVFFDPDDETDTDGTMYDTMKRLFEKNGYERHEDTHYFISDSNM